jgi:hypothetical protein
MEKITLEKLLVEVEDALRRGYSVGYVEGYSKGKDSNTIEKGTFPIIIEFHLKELKEKYENIS